MSNTSLETRNIKLGIFGAGTLGQQYLRVFNSRNDVTVIGAYDVDTSKIPEWCQEKGIRFTGRNELLQSSDAIAIATPTKQHSSDIRDCIDAGVDMFVAPPFVTRPEVGSQLLNRASDCGLIMYTEHPDIRNPAITYLRDYLSASNSEIVAVETKRFSPPPSRPIRESVVLDILIHDLDIVRNILNCTISDMEGTIKKDYGIGNLKSAKDTIISLKGSRVSQFSQRIHSITTRDAYIEADLESQSLSIFRKSSPKYEQDIDTPRFRETNLIEQPAIKRKEPLNVSVSKFVSALKNGDNWAQSAASKLESIEIAASFQNPTEYNF